MKRFFIILLIVTAALNVKSQDYSTGIGVKFGGISGLSVKQFIDDQSAFEIVAGSRWGGIEVMALYEIHETAFDVHNLYWYYGAGGHLGFWDGHKNSPWDKDKSTFVGIGVDGVLGMEYQIEDVPITISLDVVPSFNVGGYTGFWLDGGIGLRYIF